MPDAAQIVNEVLSELGRLPIPDYTKSEDGVLIYNKLLTLYPELLTRTDWNFAINYVSDSSPLTRVISPEYLYNYQLPADYDRMDRVSWFTVNFGLLYRIIDGVIMSNTFPMQYYYVSNNPSYDSMDPVFYRALVLYIASVVCKPITQDTALAKDLFMQYNIKLADAVRRNDMDRQIFTTPYNDFNRQTYI